MTEIVPPEITENEMIIRQEIMALIGSEPEYSPNYPGINDFRLSIVNLI